MLRATHVLVVVAAGSVAAGCCNSLLEAATAEPIRLEVTRDIRFSAVGKEADGNTGGATRLKLKSIQEMSLVDIDPASLRGRAIRTATLYVKLSSDERLKRVSVSTFSSPWHEGSGGSYEPQPGSSTFNRRQHPGLPWAYAGSDLTAVTLSQGGTFWRAADASPPDPDGWQAIAIDPLVVGARVAGVSHGLLVFDDTGSEWSRDGESFQFRLFPNRFFHSREGRKSDAPYLLIVPGETDLQPPDAVSDLATLPDGPAGASRVCWKTPADHGRSGVVGFFVSVEGKRLPQYLVPPPGPAGTEVVLRLDDLNGSPAGLVRIEVIAIDGAGNKSAAVAIDARIARANEFALPGQFPAPFRASAPLPQLGKASVAILDAFDKVRPDTGATIPPHPAAYFSANHLWSAQDKRVRLAAARGETVAFQIHFAGQVDSLRPALQFDSPADRLAVDFGHYHCVESAAGPLADPIVPLLKPFTLPGTADAAPDALRGSLLCELAVPDDLPAGTYRGRLDLKSAGDALQISVELLVWDFALPDELGFLPEMNCYGLPANERDYYRLAHRHRTVLNRLPYSQRGEVMEGGAPVWNGRRLDWTAWDARFGPYLDGSAFADLPRGGVPLECFYLPLHENWPSPMEGNYNGSYWADEAFPTAYREDFVEVARQMAEHFAARGWNRTLFHGFLNNKNNFKARGWSRGSSPWLLDEPASFQDYWALRFFGLAFHEGVALARTPDAKMVYRADISRPQWQRDALDGLLDYNVVGGAAFYRYNRLVNERKERFNQIVIPYGSANAIESSNLQPVAWSLDSWTLGGDGVLPWQTVGRGDSWTKADRLALFYPSRSAGQAPVPSIRLKAFCRGQQDVEYLRRAALLMGVPRRAMASAVRHELNLTAQVGSTGAGGEDAGVSQYQQFGPEQAWALRMRIGRAISDHVGSRRATTADTVESGLEPITRRRRAATP